MFKTGPKTRTFLILIIGLLFTVFFQLFMILYYRQSTSRNETAPTFSDEKSDLKAKKKDHTKYEFYASKLKAIQALKKISIKLEESSQRKNLPKDFPSLNQKFLKNTKQNCLVRLKFYNKEASKLGKEKFEEWNLPYELNPEMCNP